MMRLPKLFFISALCATFFISCSKDDEADTEVEPPRDPAEQLVEDDAALQAYLETHFYNYEEFDNPPAGFDYQVKFDTIAGTNANKTPIIDSDLLEVHSYTRYDVEHPYYVLKVREGAGAKPTLADSVYVRFEKSFLNRNVFESSTVVPEWLDLPGYVTRNTQGQLVRTNFSVPGFVEALTKFGEASGYQVNPDNTISWNNDFGIGAVFFPSGLGYYNSPQGTIPAYSPLVFSFNLLRTREADHDRDGIPSKMEDLDNNKDLLNDDTDKDGIPDHSDSDDDGDGTPTRDEIIIEEDGAITIPDTNGNGIPNYLDPEDFEPVNNED